MYAEQLLGLIDRIRATSSRNEKDELVAEFKNLEHGEFLLNWSNNPFITYGLKPKRIEGVGTKDFTPEAVQDLLDALATRTLSGNAAITAVHDRMRELSAAAAELLFLTLSKDLKCGAGENTINRVLPGLIPSFAVQRAQPYEAKRLVANKQYVAEVKLDGQRNTFLCREGKGGFFTRSGRLVPQLDFLVPVVLEAARYAADHSELVRSYLVPPGSTTLSFMLDGEAMLGLFEDTGVLRRKDADAIGAELHLYDILSYDDFTSADAVGPVFKDRRHALETFVALAKVHLKHTPNKGVIQIGAQYPIVGDQDAQALFEFARNLTLAEYLARDDKERESELRKTLIDGDTGEPKVMEGLVIKDLGAKYEKRKTFSWMKMKAEETLDLEIIGAYPGEQYTELENTLGGLAVLNGDVVVNVGGGYKRNERDELWALWQEDLANGTINPVRQSNGKIHYNYNPNFGYVSKLVGRLLEVLFMEQTPDGSLRHPRAIRIRDDKLGERNAA